MNPIFIVTDIKINNIYNNSIPKGIGLYKKDGGDIVEQYEGFRSKN
jgi:hypothetical protein